MNLYAESSAVLAWLFGERAAAPVRQSLAGADHVLCSRLTLTECARVLIRARALERVDEAHASGLAARLAAAQVRWDVLAVDETVLERAERDFPLEPLRTLDAIHLASALAARSAIPDTALLSLDSRVRECGERLGFEVLPETTG